MKLGDKPDDDKPKPDAKPSDPPDGRGERPTDPNELAKWIVEQTTGGDQEDVSQSEGSSNSPGSSR